MLVYYYRHTKRCHFMPLNTRANKKASAEHLLFYIDLTDQA